MAAKRDQQALGDDSYLDESLHNDAWTSPTKQLPYRTTGTASRSFQNARSVQTSAQDNSDTRDAQEQHLREELASVRKVNEAIEGVLASLEKAKKNMKNVNQTVGAASSLLDIWTRILSQTEHNQRLILDPSWQGSSQDIQNMEDEALARQQAVERREAEDQERRAAAAKRVEEEERKRAETASKPKVAGRGRDGLGRSGSTRTTAAANTSTSSISRGLGSSRRAGTGIGRGVRGTRSRGV